MYVKLIELEGTMTFLELAKARYSVRKFKKDTIEDAKLEAILEAGRVAPTACNNQPQKIYVVKVKKVGRSWPRSVAILSMRP